MACMSRWQRTRFPAQQFLTLAVASCVFAGLVAVLLSGFGLPGTDTAVPIDDRRAASPAAGAELADTPQIAMDKTVVTGADVATTLESVAGVPPEVSTTSDRAATIVVAALPESSQMLPTEPQPVQKDIASTPDRMPDGDGTVSSIALLDECFVLEICVDHYLWALYQRSTKVDTSKVHELRKVTVKKKRKTVIVTKRFTKLVTQDFAWKDPHAAERAGMPMMDYVIGGMDRDFKLRLFRALRAAEQAGLAPGITSGFRDDYRQSIASGLRAAANKSYHGGSARGGYGHGLAADVVSVKGATGAQRWTSTESLWKWIDANEMAFGVGRPYLKKDPAHVTPIDGEEYVTRRGTKTQLAGAGTKKQSQPAVRNDHKLAQAKRRTIVRAGPAAQTATQGALPGRPAGAVLKRRQVAGQT
jgi:hypothetical protein